MIRVRVALAALCLLAGCASVVQDAERLAQAGQSDEAVTMLRAAAQRDPDDRTLRAALMRQRELAVLRLAAQADGDRAAGRLAAARAALARAEAIDAAHPRVVALRGEIERSERLSAWLEEARQAMADKRDGEAEQRLRQLLAESSGHPGARELMRQLAERRRTPAAAASAALGPQFRRPVTVEFREAPLRAVMEGLARTHGVNFVFDKDVRSDMRISVMLKDVPLDEALHVILTTQQLELKVLNESTVLVYPGTQAKQREHQELVTRSFFLTNADVKQAQAMVRTLAKSRDLFIDERLNLIVVRDTPEVISLVERMLANLDLPDPEVMLEVEVMEISSNKLDEVGLQWPEEVRYGLPSGTTEITRADRGSLRASIANPALLATLRETVSRGNVLANPRLRARNREKAKVLIGEKLPVFASTAATANVAGTTTVSYLDVGLKLDVEPNVQLDNEVVMKVNLEVSTLIAKIAGPAGSVGYQVGTRQASTSLRLRDGETQVLAGLIRDEDSKDISGVPVLADLPVAGRLFGLHSDRRVKSEVVLLITPRVIRNVGLPDADAMLVPSGLDANPGAAPLRLRSSARVAVPQAGAAGAAGAAQAPSAAVPAAPFAGATLLLSSSGQADAGGTATVALQNRSTAIVTGEVQFDPQMLQPAQGGEGNSGRLAFSLPPGGEQAVIFRVLEAAAGQALDVTLGNTVGKRADGASVPVQVQGDGSLQVNAR